MNHQTPPADAFKPQEHACAENPASPCSSNEVQAMQARLDEMEQSFKEKELRLLAEIQNERRRMEEEAARQQKFALQKLITALLSSLDALNAALTLPEDKQDVKALLEGCKITEQQLLKTLAMHGLESIQTEGYPPFNPEEHEAIHLESHDSAPEGAVLNTYQPGYKLHGRVIRTAKVSIHQKKDTQASA